MVGNFAIEHTQLNSRHRFLQTLASQPTDRPPVWMMRQAGRYMPEYRAIRAKHSFLQMVHTPELACEVTLQPVHRLGVDAAILFSDILTIPEAMGLTVEFPEGGPRLSPVIQSQANVDGLAPASAVERLDYVGQALRLCRAELNDAHALIGFSGAPFTLACYMVEGQGSKTFDSVKALMYTQPLVFTSLLEKLADWVIAYLRMQIDAGADAVQLFDSWAGELLAADYERYVLPSTLRIAEAIAQSGGKLMLFARNAGHLQHHVRQVPAAVIGLDQRIDLAIEAKIAKGQQKVVQGNLDPIELFAPVDHIRRRVAQMHAQVDGCAWIANLGHGITPRTPMVGVEAFLQAVHDLNRGPRP